MKPSSLLITRMALLAICWAGLSGAVRGQDEIILHNFGDGSVMNDGSMPAAALIQGYDGNFYGTTAQGGSANDGTVFKITSQRSHHA